MLAGTEDWSAYELDGATARVSMDIEITDTPHGPASVAWTRVQAAATNTVLLMSIGNEGERDTSWHNAVWRSLKHS
jgi:hypothetical protein